jgi:hypothetical protein
MSIMRPPGTRNIAGVLPASGVAAPGRLRSPSWDGPSAVPSLLLAVLMVVSLSVSVPFQIAKQASFVSGDLISIPTEQIGQDSGGDEKDPTSPNLKRLRGTVSKTDVGKLLGLVIVALESTGLPVDDAGSGPVLAAEPGRHQGEPLPQELLRRPPPIG